MKSEDVSKITIPLSGRIDGNNAADVEKDLMKKLEGRTGEIVFDAGNLEYISSAGLRVILRLMKTYEKISITDVRPEVYEVLETTGFTSIIDVRKSYREVSVEGCEEIGRGATGIIYRIDGDNVVKVYDDVNALEKINHEREMAKLALILGIPTAISYDTVKVGERYGSVFELLSTVSFSHIIATEPEKIDWCVEESVKLLKLIHETRVPSGKLPDVRNRGLSWCETARAVLPAETVDRVVELIRAVPYSDTLIHGDFHTKNIMFHDDEVLIIDMETLSVGNPVFDLASMFDAYVGFSEADHEQVRRFQGFDRDTSLKFWNSTRKAYFANDDQDRINEIVERARVLGYIRMIQNAAAGKAGNMNDTGALPLWTKHLLDLLERVDTLAI